MRKLTAALIAGLIGLTALSASTAAVACSGQATHGTSNGT